MIPDGYLFAAASERSCGMPGWLELLNKMNAARIEVNETEIKGAS